MSPALIETTTAMRSEINAISSDDESEMEDAVQHAVSAINKCSRLPIGRSRRRILLDASNELCSALETSIIAARSAARERAKKVRNNSSSSRKRERRRVVVSSDDGSASDDEDYDVQEDVHANSRYPRRKKRATTPMSLDSSSGDESGSDESEYRRRPRSKRRRQRSPSNSPSPFPHRRHIPSIHISSEEPGARRSSRLASVVAAAMESEEEPDTNGYAEHEDDDVHGASHDESELDSELSAEEELVLPVVRPRPFVKSVPLAADRHSKTPVYSSDDEDTDIEETEKRRAARHARIMEDGQEERIKELHKTMPMHQIMDEPHPDAIPPTPVHVMHLTAPAYYIPGAHRTSPPVMATQHSRTGNAPTILTPRSLAQTRAARDVEQQGMLALEIAKRGIRRRPSTPRSQLAYPTFAANQTSITNQYQPVAQSYAMPARNQVRQPYAAPIPPHIPASASNPAYRYMTPPITQPVTTQLPVQGISPGTPAVSQPIQAASTQVRTISIPTHGDSLTGIQPYIHRRAEEAQKRRQLLERANRTHQGNNQLARQQLPFQTSQAQQLQQVLQTSQARVQVPLHVPPPNSYHGQAKQPQQAPAQSAAATQLDLQQQLSIQQEAQRLAEKLHEQRQQETVWRAKIAKDAQRVAHLKAMAHAQALKEVTVKRQQEKRKLMELHAEIMRRQEEDRQNEAKARALIAAHAIEQQNAVNQANQFAKTHKDIVQIYMGEQKQYMRTNYEINQKLAEAKSRVQKQNTLDQIEEQFQMAVQPASAPVQASDGDATKSQDSAGKMLDKAIQSPGREPVGIVEELKAVTAKGRDEVAEVVPMPTVNEIEFVGQQRNESNRGGVQSTSPEASSKAKPAIQSNKNGTFYFKVDIEIRH